MTEGMTGMYPPPAPPSVPGPPGGHLNLAAGRALYGAPRKYTLCWADLEMADGTVRECGLPEAVTFGLCATHLLEIWGPELAERIMDRAEAQADAAAEEKQAGAA